MWVCEIKTRRLLFLLVAFKRHFQKEKNKKQGWILITLFSLGSAQESRKAKKNILHSSSPVPVIRRPENDQREEANYRQKGNKQNNKWESVRERETSLATQPWEFNTSSVCHLHAKFLCLPSTEFPLALSALISIGYLTLFTFSHAFQDKTQSREPGMTLTD